VEANAKPLHRVSSLRPYFFIRLDIIQSVSYNKIIRETGGNIVKKKIVVAIGVVLIGLSIGMSAQSSICGIGGVEVGIHADPCSDFPELNIGLLPSWSGPPIFWLGLTFANPEYELLVGPYVKLGIPGFDVIRLEYLSNTWCCSWPSSQYLEAELRVPICSSIIQRFRNTCFFYAGLGYYNKNCDPEQATFILGLTNLWYGQGLSAGVWAEATLYKIETGVTFGSWDI